MPELAYVNGVFCDPADAVVSIEDRGFQFADGVYEVVVAYGGQPFQLEQHLKRLRRSLALVDIPIDPQRVDIEAIIREGIERSAFAETLVYLQVTRGQAPRSHVYVDSIEPTVVATFKEKPTVDPAVRAKGVSVLTVEGRGARSSPSHCSPTYWPRIGRCATGFTTPYSSPIRVPSVRPRPPTCSSYKLARSSRPRPTRLFCTASRATAS